MGRCQYRRENAIGAHRPIIQKGGKYRKEHTLASSFEKSQKNDSFGFRCLHLSVSEANDYASVTIINKFEIPARVGIRTVSDTATSPEDFEAIDRIISFNPNQKDEVVQIKIVDDEGWEPDEDFFVELYDPYTK